MQRRRRRNNSSDNAEANQDAQDTTEVRRAQSLARLPRQRPRNNFDSAATLNEGPVNTFTSNHTPDVREEIPETISQIPDAVCEIPEDLPLISENLPKITDHVRTAETERTVGRSSPSPGNFSPHVNGFAQDQGQEQGPNLHIEIADRNGDVQDEVSGWPFPVRSRFGIALLTEIPFP